MVVYYWISDEVMVRNVPGWRQFFIGCFWVIVYVYQLVKVWGYYWILIACILAVVVVVALPPVVDYAASIGLRWMG